MKKSKEKWFITGADGLIGSALFNYLESSGKLVSGSTCIRDHITKKVSYLDLASDISDWEVPERISVAFLCAAVTSQEECRENPAAARKINCTNTVELARKLLNRGVFVVFPSTNLVFDGGRAPYKESDPVNPKTEYARQKVETEKELLAFGSLVSVVRFSKIVWPEMPLLRGWIKAFQNHKPIRPFSDLPISPIPLSFAVMALVEIGAKRLPGIIHVSAREDITYTQLSYRIAEKMNVEKALVKPVSTHESGRNIEWLPAHTTLDSTRFEREFGMKAPDVWGTIDEVITS